MRLMITFSIVSHGQGHLIENFLNDLTNIRLLSYEIILTINIKENEKFLDKYSELPIKIIRNNKIKGFGENHNSAFKLSSGQFFVIVNPDIRINNPDFKSIIDFMQKDTTIGACGPLVQSSDGEIQDSARFFPTISLLLNRIFRIFFGLRNSSDYQIINNPIKVDWLAGMFIFFKREVFSSVGGFDERYFMYYEDADICWRIKKGGWSVYLYPEITVIHDAQRTSWKKFKFFRWHLRSIIRILLK